MSRWAPNARERLELAALDLFEENGYDATSVADIAERAGLTKSTFFRQFRDKREVLSGGEVALVASIRAMIVAVPLSVGPMDAIALTLKTIADGLTEERHALAARRRAAVTGSLELQERDLLKRSALTSMVTDTLTERGTDPMSARLTAEIAVLAFNTAIVRWYGKSDVSFATIALATLNEVRERVVALAQS